MNIQQPVRGTQDLLGQTALSFRHIENTAWNAAHRFGYESITTPIFEFTEVFKRSLGDTTDIITKEMYTFQDRSGDWITLRPEGTAGVVRAMLSNGLSHSLPLKFFYAGPMFRHERPQKGRFRQFHQIGVEVLGQAHPLADVETISLAAMILADLQLSDKVQLELNTLGDSDSRNRYREALTAYFEKYRTELSKDSQERLEKNPLRILDSKDENDRKFVTDAPKFADYLNDDSKKFIDEVKAGLEKLGIAYRWNDRLVRGLDYYCHTVFEFTTTALGAQNAVLAGGRYDQLVEIMGGKPAPGIGWAAGIERLSMLIESEKLISQTRPIALLPMGDQATLAAAKLAFELRQAGFTVEQTFSGNNPGKLMKKANKWNAAAAVLIGESELQSGKVPVKAMDSGEQVEIEFSKLSDYLEQNFAASKAK